MELLQDKMRPAMVVVQDAELLWIHKAKNYSLQKLMKLCHATKYIFKGLLPKVKNVLFNHHPLPWSLSLE
jgi:hypothetical protein